MCTFGLVCGDCNEMQSGRDPWKDLVAQRKRWTDDLKCWVVVTSGLSRRTIAAEEKRGGWTSSGRRRGYMGWRGGRAQGSRTGGRVEVGLAGTLEQRVAVCSRGLRQGKGDNNGVLSVPKSKPNRRGAAQRPPSSVAKEAVEAAATTTGQTSRGRACAEWAEREDRGSAVAVVGALADHHQYAGQGSRETASFSPAIWRG
jgi:hypothetical protein